MERSLISTLKVSRIIVCLITLFSFNVVYAAAGCCSHHGGVKGCNTATNYQLCKDGTTSPSCLCSGGTTNATQNKAKKTTQTTTTTSTTLPTPITTTTTKSNTAVTTNAKKTKGCCSKHGGVAGCDAASGYNKCKDGTVSTTCKC